MPSLLVPLDAANATLEEVGGKALSLIRMTRAGFPVPPGMVLTTDAYRTFVATNGLRAVIERALATVDQQNTTALEAASASIRAAFASGSLPQELVTTVHTLSTGWAHVPLAVRSSATAEDLPDLSFAGQQDTSLNVRGSEALTRAVVDCWSSLWTARAISYRARAGVPHDSVALAVVVQQLVPASVSGVLFTADPVTGIRSHTVIDATFGLGEALVSGQVEPDHYLVDSADVRVLTATRGSKQVQTLADDAGGVHNAPSPRADEWTLSPEQITELTRLGQRVQAHDGAPQDLEWAFADGRLHLLQARPITSLFPLPDYDESGRTIWFSLGAVQGMLEPLTPLGLDVLTTLGLGLYRTFGHPEPEVAGIRWVGVAGGRLWGRMDGVLRDPLGHRVLPLFLTMVDPSIASIVRELITDRRFRPESHRPPFLSLRTLGLFPLQAGRRLVPTLIEPQKRRAAFENRVSGFLTAASANIGRADAITRPERRLAARLQAIDTTLRTGFPFLLPQFAPIMGSGVAMMTLLTWMAARFGAEAEVLALECLRGLPGNVTTEMDLALWTVATVVHDDEASRRAFSDMEADELAEAYVHGHLPPAAQTAVAGFLTQSGMRGPGEIDIGTPRWRERPVDIMRTLQAYLTIEDPARAPDAVFRASVARAHEALDTLLMIMGRRDPLGLRRTLVRFMVSRIRGVMGARETPKFTIIRLFGMARASLLDSGRDLVARGRISSPDDVCYLTFSELRRIWNSTEDFTTLVAERRAATARDARRHPVPLLMLGNGRTWFSGVSGPATADLVGSAVSPGIAEGTVRVVFDASHADLQPGEILVCRGTDPAWTPLFLIASGLITEVGGMMTHGSVVAREYGIPAVVGVAGATERLRTGQRVRLDGTRGTVEFLD